MDFNNRIFVNFSFYTELVLLFIKSVIMFYLIVLQKLDKFYSKILKVHFKVKAVFHPCFVIDKARREKNNMEEKKKRVREEQCCHFVGNYPCWV